MEHSFHAALLFPGADERLVRPFSQRQAYGSNNDGLDVYKRQHRNSHAVMTAGTEPARYFPLFPAAARESERARIMAVSYTPLDVYKRQDLNVSPQTRHIQDCLGRELGSPLSRAFRATE